MSTKMRVTKLIKTINTTRRLNIVGMTKIPIIYLIKMSLTKIIMRVNLVLLTIRTIYNDKIWILQYAEESKSKE